MKSSSFHAQDEICKGEYNSSAHGHEAARSSDFIKKLLYLWAEKIAIAADHDLDQDLDSLLLRALL